MEDSQAKITSSNATDSSTYTYAKISDIRLICHIDVELADGKDRNYLLGGRDRFALNKRLL